MLEKGFVRYVFDHAAVAPVPRYWPSISQSENAHVQNGFHFFATRNTFNLSLTN